MNEEKKSLMIAEAENVEAIRDFFIQWWTVAELNWTASKVCATIIDLAARHKLSDDELEVFVCWRLACQKGYSDDPVRASYTQRVL